MINDLLPHLANDQMEKKAGEAVTAEHLNLMVGSVPYVLENDEKGSRVKYNILKILHEKYGIRCV